MNQSVIFDVKNLYCKYKNKSFAALRIDSLQIKKGEITFFIGTSGSGKSTILESMGLMNNTLDYKEGSVLQFCPNDVKIDFFELWNRSEQEISMFRRDYFNFIFQSENLFSSLSGIQNVMIPSILAGSDSEQAFSQSIKILKRVLPELNLDRNKNINIKEISGGQRQRLSFGRAVISDFSVLFADEPTGNLDCSSAQNVMDMLSDQIVTKQSTAIIVSHDIDLALKYADKIIFIDRELIKDKDGLDVSRGCITKDSTFLRDKKQWISEDSKKKMKDEEFKIYLEQKFIY
ncbi:MAG: hypothetical protein CMD23_03610 [Flavobacteriales bacterium]|nr:hypothetical protein [Flavobacteriales bacterium]